MNNLFQSNNNEIERIASNKIFLVDKQGKKNLVSFVPGLKVEFNGCNAVVEIGADPLPKFRDCEIKCADNAYVKIGSSEYIFNNVAMIISMKNGKLVIGKNFYSTGVVRFLLVSEPNCSITVGDDCLFSSNITLRANDGHVVFDKKTKNVLNKPNSIEIGNHVWCGQNVYILKNTKIKDNCIIGACSLVNKSYALKNSVIAGNPAKIVKQNVDWDIQTVSSYEEAMQ